MCENRQYKEREREMDTETGQEREARSTRTWLCMKPVSMSYTQVQMMMQGVHIGKQSKWGILSDCMFFLYASWSAVLGGLSDRRVFGTLWASKLNFLHISDLLLRWSNKFIRCPIFLEQRCVITQLGLKMNTSHLILCSSVLFHSGRPGSIRI